MADSFAKLYVAANKLPRTAPNGTDLSQERNTIINACYAAAVASRSPRLASGRVYLFADDSVALMYDDATQPPHVLRRAARDEDGKVPEEEWTWM